MPTLNRGPCDGLVTTRTDGILVMPVHGSAHVAIYRLSRGGDYWLYRVVHEDAFLGKPGCPVPRLLVPS